MKRTIIAAAVAGLALSATPALAQSASDTARFRAAQDRFENELHTFQAEFDRYQAAVDRDRGRGGYYDDGYGAPPPPPPPGGYRTAPPPPPPGAYNDDRYENGYDPSAHYRDEGGPARVLSSDDRVYRGSDGRYYCKRNDGTTGLIVGGISGAVLGNVIDGGHSRAAGTLLGGVIGAVAGKAIDQSSNKQITCR